MPEKVPLCRPLTRQNVAVERARGDPDHTRNQVDVVDVARGRGRRDRQRRSVLGIADGCSDRHLRRVVHGNDIERRLAVCDGRAIRYEPSQGPLRAGVEVRGIVARRLELDLSATPPDSSRPNSHR